MTRVTIPLDLFDDLIENTQECLDQAIKAGDTNLVIELQKELSKDY